MRNPAPRISGWAVGFLVGLTAASWGAEWKALRLPAGEAVVTAAALNSSSGYAYFATAESDFRASLEGSSGTVLQIRLSDFSVRQRLRLKSGENALHAIALDSAHDRGYLITFGDPNRDDPGRLIKISLDPLREEKTVLLPKGEFGVRAAVLSPNGDHLYLGSLYGSILDMGLPAMALQGSLGLQRETNGFQCAFLDATGRYAYFATATGNLTKVRLADFSPDGNLTLRHRAEGLRSGFLMPGGQEAYLGTQGHPAKIIRVSLTSFTATDSLSLDDSVEELVAGAWIPKLGSAFFLSAGPPAHLIRIDLKLLRVQSSYALPAEIGKVRCAVFDPRRKAVYIGAGKDGGLLALMSLEP